MPNNLESRNRGLADTKPWTLDLEQAFAAFCAKEHTLTLSWADIGEGETHVDEAPAEVIWIDTGMHHTKEKDWYVHVATHDFGELDQAPGVNKGDIKAPNLNFHADQWEERKKGLEAPLFWVSKMILDCVE